MEELNDAFIEYQDDVKKRFIDILYKEAYHKELSTGDVAMLFFWNKHRNEPRFYFLSKIARKVENKSQRAYKRVVRRRKANGQ